MSKKTLFLILLLVLTVVLLYWSLTAQQTQKEKAGSVPSVTVSPTPANRNLTTLIASPSAMTASMGEEKSFVVLVNTETNMVASAQLEMLFNQEFVEITSIAPLDFFTSPTVLLKEIDNQNGTVSYALGTAEARSGQGQLVRVTFTAKKATNNTSTPITFLPKTAIGEIGNPSSVLREAVGVNLIIR